MNCEAYRALIEEAAGRGVVAAGAGALGAHLSTCAACREFRREREALAGLLAGLERVGAPDDFEFRLRARMARQRGGARSLLRRLRLAPGLAAAGLAACLVAAAAFYLRAPSDANNSAAVRREAPAAGAAKKDDDGAERKRPSEVVVREQDGPRQTLVVATGENVSRRSGPRQRRTRREDTFGVRVAPVISESGRQLASSHATPAVAVRTSPETLRVVLRDERGGAQVLPMRSVTFGAQGPVGGGARHVRASYTDKEGVW
jgi:hypothetical protein